MASSDSATSIQPESVGDYFNQFKQLKLPNGMIKKPIGIELKKIYIRKYKNFPRFPPHKKPFEVDLSGSMTVLVGPNTSGKTNLLEAVQVFCTAVKNGSGCLSSTDANQLFGTNQEFGAMINGVFHVHYEDSDDIRSFALAVSLSSVEEKCSEYPTWSVTFDDSFPTRPDKISSKERVHIYVTTSSTVIHRFGLWYDFTSCPEEHSGIFVYRTDYGILSNLFPQVISFNSKSILDSFLSDLVNQKPGIRQHQDQINAEIRRIFPSIRLSFEPDSTTSEIINDGSSQTMNHPTPILLNETQASTMCKYSVQIFKNIASFGEGVLQCFILIVTVCCAAPHSIITIDEPDAHVFPTAQRLLMDFFYRKMEAFRQSNSFCKMFITTHSPDIMQVVKLEDIRQIFLDTVSRIPLVMKSLACIGQLYNVLTEVGASFLSHGELVRLGVHRKLLYLEGDEDFEFFHGIINRIRPELLCFPFTKVSRGGRAKPLQIKEVIKELRKFIPKEHTLHIFVLVDADLLSKDVLQTEENDYETIEKDGNSNVKIHYHCWAVREWENWLLSNENLLYEMLCDKQLYLKEPVIRQLRDRIRQHRQSETIFSNTNGQDQLTTATSITTTSVPLYSVDKQLFDDWFIKELRRCFEKLYKQLTLSQMGGNEINEQNSKDIDYKYCEEFLEEIGITDDTMEKFGDLNKAIRVYIGQLVQQQREPKKKRPKNNPNKIIDELENCRAQWLSERQLLQEPIKIQELTKWIDAKLFFHQLTNGKDNESKKRDLDTFWRQAFSQTTSGENNLYGRYFNSLDQQQYPQDFSDLVEKFEKFITAS